MVDTSDLVIFWIVVLGRLLIPLTIPRFPLPGVVAALVLDGVDQSIFQQYTKLPLEGYQGYDKALDIYYLTIAYISTLRNWTHRFAFQVSRFLFYYRLVGVVLFELTHIRPLLLLFPNTFEYFFIFYEAVRLRWNPLRMSRRLVLGAAAFIWIFIKLPQEYWIHIAQLDTTDVIKQGIFGVPVDTPWGEIMAANPLVFLGAIALIAVLLFAAWWFVNRKLPAKDFGLDFRAADYRREFTAEQQAEAKAWTVRKLWDRELVEKVAMISLIGVIFAKVLPGVQATNLQLAIGVAFVVLANAALSQWLARRGQEWADIGREFVVMLGVNFGLVALSAYLLPQYDGRIDLTNTLFFALLLTLLVVLYDRYRVVYLERFPSEA